MLKVLKAIAEKVLLKKKRPVQYPPIFISGCPRSGTTISFQYLVNKYACSYFSNLEKHNPEAPVLSALMYRACNNYKANSDSFYGKIEGDNSPSDGWMIFHRWFPYYYGETRVRKLDGLKNTIGWLEWIYDRPFIVKNNASSLRIASLATAFPSSLFIHIERDFHENISSLVEGLKKNNISIEKMWGTGPPSKLVDYKFSDDIEKSVFQFEFVAAYVRRVEKEFPDVKLFRVSYTDVLKTGGDVLAEIVDQEYEGELVNRKGLNQAVKFRKNKKSISSTLIQRADEYREEMKKVAITTLNKIHFE